MLSFCISCAFSNSVLPPCFPLSLVPFHSSSLSYSNTPSFRQPITPSSSQGTERTRDQDRKTETRDQGTEQPRDQGRLTMLHSCVSNGKASRAKVQETVTESFLVSTRGFSCPLKISSAGKGKCDFTKDELPLRQFFFCLHELKIFIYKKKKTSSGVHSSMPRASPPDLRRYFRPRRGASRPRAVGS